MGRLGLVTISALAGSLLAGCGGGYSADCDKGSVDTSCKDGTYTEKFTDCVRTKDVVTEFDCDTYEKAIDDATDDEKTTTDKGLCDRCAKAEDSGEKEVELG